MKKNKVHKTLRLDPEVVDFFESESKKTGISFNALLNSALLVLIKKKDNRLKK